MKTPTGQTVLLKKILRKFDLFIFVSRSLPCWPNAIVVCRPPSSFPLVVCRLISCAVVICRLHRPPLSSSAIAVVAYRRHPHPPPPCSAAAAIITTLLSPPSLTALSSPSPLQSAAQSACCRRPPPSSSATAIVRRCRTSACPPSYLKMLIVALC